jgi:folate-binding protein YgfZ
MGGPAAHAAVEKATGSVPPARPFDVVQDGALFVLRLPADRYLLRTPREQSAALWQRCAAAARASGLAAWEWLAVRAGVPVILPVTQDQFVPQSLNWDALGGISFRKGCYSGQEIVARMQYLGRLKERLFLAHLDADPPLPGERVFSSVFGEQPCGTVVNAAVAPDGGSDLLAVIQVSAVDSGDLHLATPGGPPLSQLPLPYDLPPVQAPRGRIA